MVGPCPPPLPQQPARLGAGLAARRPSRPLPWESALRPGPFRFWVAAVHWRLELEGRRRGGGALTGLYLSFLWESSFLFLVFSMFFSLAWWRYFLGFCYGESAGRSTSAVRLQPTPPRPWYPLMTRPPDVHITAGRCFTSRLAILCVADKCFPSRLALLATAGSLSHCRVMFRVNGLGDHVHVDIRPWSCDGQVVAMFLIDRVIVWEFFFMTPDMCVCSPDSPTGDASRFLNT